MTLCDFSTIYLSIILSVVPWFPPILYCLISHCLHSWLHKEFPLISGQRKRKLGPSLQMSLHTMQTSLEVFSKNNTDSASVTPVRYAVVQISFKLHILVMETKIMASGPITSWQIDGETVETVIDFIFLGSKITADGGCSHEIKTCLSLEGKLWPT